MRTFIFSITLILLFSANVFEQENATADTIQPTAEEEKSSVYINGSSFNFIFNWDKKIKNSYDPEAHWTGFGVSLSQLNGLNGINQGTSTYIHLNLLDYDIPMNKNFLFAIGLGFDWQSYKFKGNVSLRNDDDGITRFIFGILSDIQK